jgi:hypothetical protein
MTVMVVYASSVMMVYTAPLPAVGRPHVTSKMFGPEAVHHDVLGCCDVLGNECGISRQGLATATAAAAAAAETAAPKT